MPTGVGHRGRGLESSKGRGLPLALMPTGVGHAEHHEGLWPEGGELPLALMPTGVGHVLPRIDVSKKKTATRIDAYRRWAPGGECRPVRGRTLPLALMPTGVGHRVASGGRCAAARCHSH